MLFFDLCACTTIKLLLCKCVFVARLCIEIYGKNNLKTERKSFPAVGTPHCFETNANAKYFSDICTGLETSFPHPKWHSSPL